ncbi:MAG: peptidyl-prolyl cis-trans isomerase [Lachnospiraceae bacterium]|nr:peptidyl-prolyl cis-trans isomerase [Lachnospiraceae bacterium]
MSFKKIFTIIFCVVCLAAVSIGCAKLPERTIHEVPRKVTSYSASQMYLALAGRRSEMKNVYTDKIFDVQVSDTGKRYEETFRDIVYDYLIKVQVMAEMCDEREIELSMTDTKNIEKAAKTYMEEFATCGNLYDITEEEVVKMMSDLKKIEMLRELIVEESDIEVSDSDARVMDVMRIELPSSEAASEVMEKIQSSQDADFFNIARHNSENGEIELSVGMGDLGDVFDEEIFRLNDGEVSPVIQSNGKYYIFKCISGYNEDATAARKEKMTKERQSRAIGLEYEKYLSDHPYEMDEVAFNEAVKMCNDNPEAPDIYEAIE